MRFLIVDDHPLVREALASLLMQLRPASVVLHAASAAEGRLALATEPFVDLVLLDLRLPDASGLDLLKTIGRNHMGTAAVVLSGDLDRPTVRRALAEGAVGCIPKTETRDVLASALSLVLAGGVYVPLMMLDGLTDPSPRADRKVSAPEATARTPQQFGLTERQLEVLALLMQGKNNKLIGRALGLAEPTVKNHVSAILRALQVNSRTEAVLAVSPLGWQLPLPRQLP